MLVDSFIACGISIGKRSVYSFLYLLSSVFNIFIATSSLIHVLIAMITHGGSIVCESMVNCSGFPINRYCSSLWTCMCSACAFMCHGVSNVHFATRCWCGDHSIGHGLGSGGFRRLKPISLAMAALSSTSAMILFLVRKSRQRITSVCRLGQMIAFKVLDLSVDWRCSLQ